MIRTKADRVAFVNGIMADMTDREIKREIEEKKRYQKDIRDIVASIIASNPKMCVRIATKKAIQIYNATSRL